MTTSAPQSPEASVSTDPAPAPAVETHEAVEIQETVENHEPSVHDVLLETVSADALQSHGSEDADEAGEPASEAEPAASEAVAPEPVADAPVTAAANDREPVENLPAATPPASIVVPMRPVAVPAFRRASAIDALSELSETNATVVAFLRNESSATLAHWKSLARAKSPADAVRLQVDEMQRAADASLTCLNTLAKRAGRFAGILTGR